MPTFGEIIEAKYRYAKTRWHEDGEIAGFKKYFNRDYFVFGWCGQTASPGYALQVLADDLGDSNAAVMAKKSLDFLSTAEFYDQGFYTWYDYGKKQWTPRRRRQCNSRRPQEGTGHVPMGCFSAQGM